ncbi:MAG TPA: hypothetical protein VK932_19915, partial [Kofleriaceae bacterium]|nr:hypothetical protein [Kofleriaceae bacterium]
MTSRPAERDVEVVDLGDGDTGADPAPDPDPDLDLDADPGELLEREGRETLLPSAARSVLSGKGLGRVQLTPEPAG